jgi:alginate O-acetyltransferase complex protein AlgI
MLGMQSSLVNPAPVNRFLHDDVVLAIIAGIIASGPYGSRLLSRIGNVMRVGDIQVGQLAGLAAVFLLITLSLAAGAYNPFIYFRF